MKKHFEGKGVQTSGSFGLIRGACDGSGLRIGVVVSRWNDPITKALFEAAVETLRNAGVADENILGVEVPGAFEIPLALQTLAERGDFDGLVALGAVIKGETTHFEHVSEAAMHGIREVSLRYRIPIGCGVLTTLDESQALARAGSGEENKGREAALATLEMISLIARLGEKSLVHEPDDIHSTLVNE